MTNPDTIPTQKILELLTAAFPGEVDAAVPLAETIGKLGSQYQQLSTVTGIVFAGLARIDEALRAAQQPGLPPTSQPA